MKETLEEKNQRKLDLFVEFGVLLGPVIQRETEKDLVRVVDCIDCLLVHTTELLNVYYSLSEEQSIECYKLMRKQIQIHIDKIIDERTQTTDSKITVEE